jgi:hypothetical protein
MAVNDLTRTDPFGSATAGTTFDDAQTGAPGRMKKLTFYVDGDVLRGFSVQYDGQQSSILHGGNGAQATDVDMTAHSIVALTLGVYTNTFDGADPNDAWLNDDGRVWIRDVRIRLENGAEMHLGTGPAATATNYTTQTVGFPAGSELAAFYGRSDVWLDQIGCYFRPRPADAPGTAADPSAAEASPLIGCRIGTPFWSGGRWRAGNTLDLNTSISVFTAGGTGDSSMTGHSRFFHTEGMNQGSLSFAGGYGVSGVASVTASVDAYVGQSAAHSSRDVEVSYNVFFSSGVESLPIDQLTMTDLINSLAPNTKRSLLAALDAYVGLRAAAGANGSGGVIAAVGNGNGQTPIEAALDRWTAAVDRFLGSYGDGFVTAVHWGARGSVKFTMSSGSSATSWEYGGAAQFSYAGVAAAVSLKAAYDGSSKSQDADVTVTVKGFYSGIAIKPEIDAWVAKFANLGFDKLASVEPLSVAPDLSHPPSGGLTVPAFRKPPEQPDTGDALKKLEDSSAPAVSAADATKAASFKKEKDADKAVTQDEFEKKAEQKIDPKPLDELVSTADPMEAVEAKPAETGDSGAAGTTAPSQAAVSFAAVGDAPATSGGDSSPAHGDVIPLGVLVCSWADIFPWVSRTIDNDIASMGDAKRIVQWRLMIQDGLQLSNLYYLADAIGLEFPGPSTLRQLGDDFASMAERLQTRTTGIDPTQLMKDAYALLSDSARVVYTTWCKAGFLRQGELGFGLVYRESLAGPWLTSASYTSYETISKVESGPCDFDAINRPQPYPLHLFAQAVKPSPIISATGEIRAFCEAGYLGLFSQLQMAPRTGDQPPASGSQRMWLSFSRSLYAELPAGTRAAWDPDWNPNLVPHFGSLLLSPDGARQCLSGQGGQDMVCLFPLSVDAAKGVSWSGALTAGVSVSSFQGLQDSLKGIRNALAGQPRLTFGGKGSDFADWSSTMGLSDLQNAKDHYLGIIPQAEMMGVFQTSPSTQK